VQPAQQRSRQLHTEPIHDETLHSSNAQRSNVDQRNTRAPVEVGNMASRLAGSHGQNSRTARLAQAPKREIEHGARRPIDPLKIVDREHRTALSSEDTERRHQRSPQRPHIRSPRGPVREQKRRFQRAPLRRRQLRQHLVDDRLHQIREDRQPQRPLSLHRTGYQHTSPLIGSRSRRRLPQRRLAHTSLAGQNNDRAPGLRPHTPHHAQLISAPHDPRGHRTHPPGDTTQHTCRPAPAEPEGPSHHSSSRGAPSPADE
jgi:hypothetical protein